jgi:ribosomal protein L11 methyltransferase
MGFGTGHHASTRLCVQLLQEQTVADRRVLDVGTGSGVLAICSARLGARQVVAIDLDEDALRSAKENVEQNGAADTVVLSQVELTDRAISGGAAHLDGRFDLVLANLTGASLTRLGSTLAGLLDQAGLLIVGGVMEGEARQVLEALAGAGLAVDRRLEEDDWVAALLSLQRPALIQTGP